MTNSGIRFTLPDLRSFAPSLVRTVTPLIVGYFTAFPIAKAVGLDAEHVTAAVTVVVTFLYYLLVRVLEQYVLPQAGWLLGYASAPVYVPPADAGATKSAAGDVALVIREHDTRTGS
jgi:hypothetical protein